MGRMSRNKGRRGQGEAFDLLRDRDWMVVETSAGQDVEDGVCTDPDGQQWSVEVKNAVSMNIRLWLGQAREQAAKRKLPWMLMCRIDGGHGWLIIRKHEKSAVWHKKDAAPE